MRRADEAAKAAVPRLSRTLIIEVGVAIADAEGIAAVSMGRLGRELGVTTMGLYRHVDSKHVLMAAMAERVLDDLDLTWSEDAEILADWQRVARRVIYSWADLVAVHPGAVRLIYLDRPVTRVDMMPPELVLSALLRAGSTPAAAARAYRTIVLFVDSVLLGASIGGEAGQAHWSDLPPELLDELPAVRRVAEQADRLTYQEIFDHGVDLLIAAIARDMAAG